MDLRAATLARYRRHVNVGTARLADMMGMGVEVEASGSYVFDQRGERYLDCGGYCVFFLGHRHPEVVQAVKAQLDRMPLSSRLLLSAELGSAAEALREVTPPGLEYVWFANTGAEAVEAALKIAWLLGKRRLIAMEGGYHGKTLGALSLTGNAVYREPFTHLLPDVTFVPYGQACALEERLAGAPDDACVIVEPVQSERGVIIPPAGYLKEVERLCRRHGAALILDEISTGLGRIGHWWGADREAIVPDVLLAGKALSGGVVPVSAAVCSTESYAALNRDPMLHTSTFAGNPLAAVAARTAIEVIRTQGLVEHARRLGHRLLAGIERAVAGEGRSAVLDVRGLGLLIGIEFHTEHLAAEFILELLRQRLLVSHSLNNHRVVRLTPPVTLADGDVDWLLSAVGEAVRATARRVRRQV